MGAVLRRKIHLERPQLILLAFCAFLVLLNVFLVSSYVPADRQRDQLLVQVSALERAVQRLQARGATASSGVPLQPGEDPFPAQVPTAELTNLVVQAGAASGVKVDNINPLLGTERLVNNTYRTYKVSMRATGTAAQVADFLGRIERGPVRSWVIDNMQAKPGANAVWDVTFDVLTYAH